MNGHEMNKFQVEIKLSVTSPETKDRLLSLYRDILTSVEGTEHQTDTDSIEIVVKVKPKIHPQPKSHSMQCSILGRCVCVEPHPMTPSKS